MGRFRRNMRRLTTILAAMIVFVTVYALIIPAISLDLGRALHMPGVFLGKSGSVIRFAGSNGAGEAAGDLLEDDYPAQMFMASTRYLSITAEAQAGTFPAGTSMEVRTVGDQDVLDGIREAAGPDMDYVQAVDIIFRDAQGNEIEPLQPIRVSMSHLGSTNVEEAAVIHMDDNGTAEVMEAVDPSDLEQVPEENEVVFEAESFSVYAFVGMIIEKNILTSDGKNYKITLTYGEDAGIPAGTELSASEIREGSLRYQSYKDKAAESLGMQVQTISYARFLDIFLMKDGIKLQPKAPVSMKIELLDKDSSDAVSGKTQVMHFANDKAAGDVVDGVQIRALGTSKAVQTESADKGLALSFDVDGFSVYAIVDAPEPAAASEPRNVQDLSELAQHTDEAFYLSVTRGTATDYYFRNAMNGNSCFLMSSGNALEADTWFFEKADQNGKTWYIYTLVDGERKYVRNTSGNLAGLIDASELENATGAVFEISQAETGLFYFKVKGANKWLQYSRGGSGIRFWTDVKDAGNSRISITYASSLALDADPYGLDSKSFGIAYHNNSVISAAMTAQEQTVSNHARLASQDMLMKPDVLDNDGILLVAPGSDIQMWTFHSVGEDKYYLTAKVGSEEKYLTIRGTDITLKNEPDETYSVVKAVPGTGEYSGKWRLSVNGYALNLPEGSAKGFNAVTGTGAAAWMNLVERSVLEEEDFKLYAAKKVSISDKMQVCNGQQVILYTRIWNDTKKKYEFFAVDHDGSLIPCFDAGDKIEWIGTRVNTALWAFTEYYETDGSPNYFYELQNTQYGNYIAPQTSAEQTISGNKIGINLNGRRYGENYSPIIAWDDASYAYSGLKTENGHIVPCALSEAEDFYFALVHPVDVQDQLSEVKTIDSDQFGITMHMFDFNNRLVKERDSGQAAFMGGEGGKGLLSTNLGEDGYPTGTDLAGPEGKGVSLSKLISSHADGGKSDGVTPANHLFIESIYNESGYFEYDSTMNFAHLNEDGTFTVYDQIGAITGSAEHKVTREHGQFMPYNNIEAGMLAYDSSGEVITNRTDVLANELPDTEPRKGEAMYSIGSTTTVNYFFGMEMGANFTQTANGLDEWGHDIIFEFSGDDDFWLYVDGELVLDLGGIHSAQVGSVNFRTGVITSSNGNSTLYETFRKHYQDRGMSQEEITRKLDGDGSDENPGIFEEKTVDGKTVRVFKDYSNHSMKVFYMERGAGASNLHMRFNLAAVKPGTIVLSKKLSGTESASNSLIEFPYQVYYKTRSDGGSEYHLLPEKADDGTYYATYKGTTAPVTYKESFTPAGGTKTYDHVFFLKPGQSAVIDLPDDTIDYYIVECAVNTSVYDRVTANGDRLSGSGAGSGKGSRKDFATSAASMEDRPKVDYDNHVREGAMRTLSIKKKLYDVDGSTLLHYPDNSTLFTFRLYLGNEYADAGSLPLSNLYSYFVKDTEGNYCRWNAQGQYFEAIEFKGSLISTYSELSTYLDTLTKVQKESVIFKTSMNGTISKIPADYTVEVRDLIVGTQWKVEERDGEIPKGYTRRDGDGYARTDTEPEISQGTPVGGTMQLDEDPAVEVRNQKGWGLTAEKVWTDQDFMEMHDDIYFAVYLNGGLVEDTVRRLKTTEKEIYYFFDDLYNGTTTSHSFDEYSVREVTLTEGDGFAVDEETGLVTGYASVTPIEDGGILNIGGQPSGGEYRPAGTGSAGDTGYEYTVGYTVGTATGHNENIRTDTVTNSRPGIKLYKRLWDGQTPLSGAVFTLKDDSGSDVAADQYISGGSDGLITIAYLNSGVYTLTETETPKGYAAAASPLTITVDGNTVTVSGPENSLYPEGSLYEVDQAPEDGMTAAIIIRNPAVSLQVKKVDLAGLSGGNTSEGSSPDANSANADSSDGNSSVGTPIAGVHFALYHQVTNDNGEKVKDYLPISGYEDLVSNEEGILTFADSGLEAITIENLAWGHTYYLTETQAADGYGMLDKDLCFTISRDGKVTVESEGHEDWLTARAGGSDEAGMLSYLLTIPNAKRKKISLIKIDLAAPDTSALSGAEFDLYKLDEDGNAPETPYLAGLVSGEDGMLATVEGSKTIFELPVGIYHLVETKAPEGFLVMTEPAVITITDQSDLTSAGFNDGRSLAGVQFDDRTDMTVSRRNMAYDAATGIYTLRVPDKAGYALPSTGGPGTRLFTVLGWMLILGAGAGLVLRRRNGCV